MGAQFLPLYTGDKAAPCSPAATRGRIGRCAGPDAQRHCRSEGKRREACCGAGFAYLRRGPDDAIIEYQGNMPAERFNHSRIYRRPAAYCAQLWYQQHLNEPVPGWLRRGRPGDAAHRSELSG